MNKPTVFPELADEYEAMRAELEASPFTVELFPAPDARHEGHMVRVACVKNPAWYRHLCAEHPSTRGTRRGKFDTRIRRRGVLRALARMADGSGSMSLYAPELLRLAVSRLRKAHTLKRSA